jgi:hypothetical protein
VTKCPGPDAATSPQTGGWGCMLYVEAAALCSPPGRIGLP